MWVSTWSSIRCGGARLGYSVDTILPRAKRKLLWKPRRASWSSWSGRGNHKSFTLTILWNLARFVKTFLESVYVDTTQIGNWWDCWKSSAQSGRRDISGAVAIRSGWKMVSRFHGMLPLSPKHSKSFFFNKKTPYERRFGIPFNGPVIPFGATVEYHPVSAEDLSRLHQFGPKVLPGIFFGYALNAWRIWKGEIPIADTEEMEQMDASELYARRLNAKEVLTPMKGENFIFPIVDGTVKIDGGDGRLGTSTLIRDSPDRGEEQDNLRGESDGSSSTLRQDSSWCDGEAKSVFGLSQEILFVVVTWNPESNCTCRLQNHSLFCWKILTLPELPIQLWVWCRKNILMITGMLIEKESCWMHGQVSQDSLYWMRNHLMENIVPRLTDEEKTTSTPDNGWP